MMAIIMRTFAQPVAFIAVSHVSMYMAIQDKRVVIVLIEQRLEIDGVDSMEKIIIQQIVPIEIDIDRVLDKIREILEQSKENQFTFL